MNDGERAVEIARLLRELSASTARKTALLEEVVELAARIHEIRAAFGNPFFYSHPEHADESAAHYSGPSSHDVVLPTLLALQDVDRELATITEQLHELGVTSDQNSN
jgi:hypothetical protein